MATKLQKLKWMLHCYKEKQLLYYGLLNGLIFPYHDELIEKLRNVYYGGIPASIILLSDGMTNGHCYDRALLMSQVFLEDDGDIQLLYATIDSLKLNPKFISDDPLYADHCVCERITKDGKHYIFDTSKGFIFDKRIYWLMENPKVRKINNKESIKQYFKIEGKKHPENIDNDKYASPFILPMIEMMYGRPNEMYSFKGRELLQREIDYYKQLINYDEIVGELDKDVKTMELNLEKIL